MPINWHFIAKKHKAITLHHGKHYRPLISELKSKRLIMLRKK